MRTPEQRAKLAALFGTPERRAANRIAQSSANVNSRRSAAISAARAGKALSEKQRIHLDRINACPEVRAKVIATLATPETKKRTAEAISKARRGKPIAEHVHAAAKAATVKPFRCVDADVNFGSLSEAIVWLVAKGHTKAAKGPLIAAAKGVRGYKSAYGHRWAYA